MTRTLILFLLLSTQALARDQCDLSQSVGVQLPSGQILGVKDLVSDFILIVVQQSCSKGAYGDDCSGSFDPNTQISEDIKMRIAVSLKADKNKLKFIKKPNMRQPASQAIGTGIGISGKCI